MTKPQTGQERTGQERTGKERTGKDKAADKAPAFDKGSKPGPADSPVQVRNAGKDAQADKPTSWDEQDDALDESFPASDSSAKY